MDPATFQCANCGACCRSLLVRMTPADIERVKSLGFKEFLWRSPSDGSWYLKQSERGCVFLENKDGRSHCRIYHHRPEVCRRYPFVEGVKTIKDCVPSTNLDRISKKQQKMLKGSTRK